MHNERRWFYYWIIESYNIRQLSCQSGHSPFKLKKIKNYWLDRPPKEPTDFTSYKHILYDGTYFGKNGCLISLMDAKSLNIISKIYAHKEGGKVVSPWFRKLKEQGLNPLYVVMDGEQTVIRTIKSIWPGVKVQRCLYHIQREGTRWLRTYPKTAAARELKTLLITLSSIKTIKERDVFINSYNTWLAKYEDFVKSLPIADIACKDLKRTIVLINNALADMFHYLEAPIPATTNALEGFYSRLKTDYQRHRGLTQKHKINYLMWYCYLKNSNNL